jgi:hypothetical protein
LHNIPAFTYSPALPDVYGGNSFIATINMGFAIPIAATFTFSDTAAAISSPRSTTMAVGQQTKSVLLGTATVASTVNATISARLANTTATSPVAVHPRPDLQALSCAPNSVVGGNPSTGTVTMNFAGAAGSQTVSLTDSSSIVGTPVSVIVPGGAASANFGITTSPVTANYNVTIKATLRTITRSTILNVHP